MSTMIPGGSRWESEKNNVGLGWQPIIEQLHADLLEIAPNYEVLQIKEKFGGLRYYVSTGEGFDTSRTHDFWTRIEAAEKAAGETCEDCGRDDETVSNGTLGPGYNWTMTLCAECRGVRYTYAETQRAIRKAGM